MWYVKVEGLEHFLSIHQPSESSALEETSKKETHRRIGVQLESSSTRVERGDLGDVVVLALALLLLELERNAANGTTLNALHEVGGEPRDLVPETFRGDVGLPLY